MKMFLLLLVITNAVPTVDSMTTSQRTADENFFTGTTTYSTECDPHCNDTCTQSLQNVGPMTCDGSCEDGYALDPATSKCVVCDPNCAVGGSGGCRVQLLAKCDSACNPGYALTVDHECFACDAFCAAPYCAVRGPSKCDENCLGDMVLSENYECVEPQAALENETTISTTTVYSVSIEVLTMNESAITNSLMTETATQTPDRDSETMVVTTEAPTTETTAATTTTLLTTATTATTESSTSDSGTTTATILSTTAIPTSSTTASSAITAAAVSTTTNTATTTSMTSTTTLNSALTTTSTSITTSAALHTTTNSASATTSSSTLTSTTTPTTTTNTSATTTVNSASFSSSTTVSTDSATTASNTPLTSADQTTAQSASTTVNATTIGSTVTAGLTSGWNGSVITSTPSPLTDPAPPITAVRLEGPTVINRLWIEFYCVISTTVTVTQAKFSVKFLFDGQSRTDVPGFVATASNLTVTLHEKYLTGKLGTSLQCMVQSFWSATPTILGSPMNSNSYWMMISPSISWLMVTENEQVPQMIYWQSTLPLTCHDATSAASVNPCYLAMEIETANDIAVFQAGIRTPQQCKYLLTEESEQQGMWYYNSSQSLAVIAKSDPYVTFTRYSQLIFKFPTLPLKTAGGFTYASFWSQYGPPFWYFPWVYRYDSGGAVLTCTATADVHYQTFDGLFYSSYGSGPFIYSRSTAGQPFEVQARQGSCSGPFVPNAITCVCGVAMREDNTILILDACQSGVLRAVGYNHKDLPMDSGIFADNSGYSFKIQMPSGNKVYVDYWGYIMNLRLVVIGRPKLQGMCGSPDGNPSNDLLIQGTTTTKSPEAGGWAGPQGPVDVVDSWRPTRGRSLFDGYLASLPTGGVTSNGIEVPPVSTYPKCSYKSDLGYPGEATRRVKVLSPSKAPLFGAGRRRRRSIEAGVDADDQYDPSQFTYQDTTDLMNITWPTRTGITEQQANDTCWSLIVNPTNLGPSCMEILRNATSDAQDVVTKCVLDVQLTSDYSWARDKVAELLKSCYFNAITQNNSAINNTDEAILTAVNDVQQVSEAACVPYDCNGHGICVNGTCNCTADYIGADCKVSKSAVPTVSSLLTSSDCNVRVSPCSTANLQAENASSVPTLSCKVVVTMRNGSYMVYTTPGQIQLAPAVTCDLPTEPLNFTSASLNFSTVHDPGFSFYCLSTGSPATTYTISVSNDGVHFGNGLPMRIVDTACMTCSSSACSQKPNTCLINGYCFNAGDVNPFVFSQSCQPGVSSSFWSNQQGVAVPLTGTCQQTSCPTGTSSVQSSDSTFSCLPIPITTPKSGGNRSMHKVHFLMILQSCVLVIGAATRFL